MPVDSGVLLLSAAVRSQRIRGAISTGAGPGPGTGADSVCTPVAKAGGVRVTPSSPTLRSSTVEGGSVPKAPSVSVGRAPKSLWFSGKE